MQPAPAAFTLFTVGDQGHTIETFLDLLLAHGIAHIIDVRQLLRHDGCLDLPLR